MSTSILEILQRDDIQETFKDEPFMLAESAARRLMSELSEEATFNRKQGIGISEAIANNDLSYIHDMIIYGIKLKVVGFDDDIE